MPHRQSIVTVIPSSLQLLSLWLDDMTQRPTGGSTFRSSRRISDIGLCPFGQRLSSHTIFYKSKRSASYPGPFDSDGRKTALTPLQFQEFLSDKANGALFRAFLEKEYSQENIEFWYEIESFKKLKSKKQQKKAKTIYEKYIEVNAPSELNISARHRKQAQSKMESGDPTMFDEIQLEVFTLMERDSFPRFFFLNFIKQEAPKWRTCNVFYDVLIIYCRGNEGSPVRNQRNPGTLPGRKCLIPYKSQCETCVYSSYNLCMGALSPKIAQLAWF